VNAFSRIAIIGVGLIGGSIGLALKRKKPEIHRIGIDASFVIDEALGLSAIDEGIPSEQMEKAISSVDLVFLCTPIHEILRLLPKVAHSIKPGALVTDVGSTKRRIVELADEVFPEDRYFIGGHPMAGSEGRGIKWADALLFENAVYVLTPSRPLPPALMKTFGETIEVLGAKILLLTPTLHDRIAAAVSHLPQILAVTLMNLVAQHQTSSPYFLKLAAGGFRDMTRIASSPYELWKPIIETNQEEILAFVDEFIDALKQTKQKILDQALEKEFMNAAQFRLSIPRDTKGFLRPHYDILVPAEDKPGIIAKIATALANAQINIKDIEILKVREGDAGTLRLSFETPEQQNQAQHILKEIGFSSRRMNG